MNYTFRARDLNVVKAESGASIVEVPIQILDEKGVVVSSEAVTISLAATFDKPSALKTEFVTKLKAAAEAAINKYVTSMKLREGLLSVLLGAAKEVSVNG